MQRGDVEANVGLQRLAMFKSCVLKFDAVCTTSICLSDLSKVTTRPLLCYERLLSTRISDVACILDVVRVGLSNVLLLQFLFHATVKWNSRLATVDDCRKDPVHSVDFPDDDVIEFRDKRKS